MNTPGLPDGMMLPAGRHGGSPTAAGTLSPFSAVILDLDGVVTDTASVHRAAWKELFERVLADARMPPAARSHPYTDDDYFRYLDGRTRLEGIAALLASRHTELPEGDPADPPEAWTLNGLGNAKNLLFRDWLRQHGVKTFPGTVDFVDRLRAGRVPVGLVTASRNAVPVLTAAGLEDAFDAVVDGYAAAQQHLAGKPDPAMFLEAARRLHVPPQRIAVLEDSAAGIAAARAGGFGLAVGIDRTGRRRDLERAGAQQVLEDVAEFDIGLVLADPWHLVYDGFDPQHEGHREALTALGNGYLATRGAAPERAADGIHYPGTYLAGVYNSLPYLVDGVWTVGEHMVNAPNWLPFDLRLGGKWWSDGALAMLRERRDLDLKRALLVRHVLLRDEAGRRLDVRQRRIVSMARPHLALLETTLTARGWSGMAELRTGIDGEVLNRNVPEDAALGNRHLRWLPEEPAGPRDPEDLETLEVETNHSRIRIATAVRTGFGCPDTAGNRPHVLPAPAPSPEERDQSAGTAEGPWRHAWTVHLSDGMPLSICRTAAMVTSRDPAIASPLDGAKAALARTPEGFAEPFAEHEAAWRRLLRLFTIDLHADPQTQLILNLHVFHLLQTLTPHTAGLDAGVPARGLHGEGYRGHIFWDDLFVLPLLTSRLPAVSRSVLDYRWRRLDAARDAARAAGLPGAMFPWRSGSDGTEQTPSSLFNRYSGRWMADNSRLQRHGGLAVAYNAWQYFEATQDRDWLLLHGAEIIVEVARLFSAMATSDDGGRYHLRGVMGPDEYHDGYPGTPGSGLDDNAYTNVMTAWVCTRVARIMRLLQGRDGRDLRERLGIGTAELDRWRQLSRRLYVPFHDGIISQFEGYGDLRELDWARLRRRYGKIERLDLILAAEGDSPNHYRLSKQADVLMLFYVLGEDQLRRLLQRLGYPVTQAQLDRTVDFYLARTVHGSTLSRVAHASVLAASDPERAWSTFREALDADLDDTQGGTTRTGIHLGAMAGSIDVIQRSFAGLRLAGDELVFAPRLPAELEQVSFRLRYRDNLLDIALDHSVLQVSAARGSAPPVRVRVGARTAVLAPGATVALPLPAARPPRTGGA